MDIIEGKSVPEAVNILTAKRREIDALLGQLIGQGADVVRKKGAIEIIDGVTAFGAAALGVKIHVRHLGPGSLRAFVADQHRLRIQEALRMAKVRAGLTREHAPDLWQLQTPEGLAEGLELANKVIRQYVAKVEFDKATYEGEAAAQQLEYLGLTEVAVSKIMEIQTLTRQEFPSGPDIRFDPGQPA